MSLVRVHNFSISLDGYGTGEGLSREAPFGHAGDRLVGWMKATRFWHDLAAEMGLGTDLAGQRGGSGGVDNVFAQEHGPGIGVEIMGAGKFGPPGWPTTRSGRAGGARTRRSTHRRSSSRHARPPLELEGGTTFHFLDASPAEALEVAREAAGGQDVRIGGGATMLRDFLAAGLVGHMHIAVVPILLGRGVRLWDGLEGLERGYGVEAVSSPSGVTHLTFSRKGA